MVRLRLATPGRLRGGPRGPVMMPRPMRPHVFQPDFIPPYRMPRGGPNFRRGPPIRPGPPRSRLPPPMVLPPQPLHRPLPPPTHQPLPPREMPRLHPMHIPGRHPVMPHPMPPGRPLRRPMRPGPASVRGRGGFLSRGVSVKRLGSSANGPSKKAQKRKEKTEEMEANKPWVTEALKTEIHKKYLLYETAKEKKTESDWQAYKEQRILVGIITNTAKLEYIGSHPEAGDFFCETCDRSFKTTEKLDEHLSQHEVCGREGCTFTAHPKIILKHVQVQHDSGLYHKIPFTQNPDDVAKWVAARKSCYPTKENVEKKEAQTNEMMKRGERISREEKRFQNSENKGNWRGRWQKRNDNFVKPKAEVKHRKPTPKQSQTSGDSKWRDPDAWRGDLPKFSGTAYFSSLENGVSEESKEGNRFSDDDDDEWSNKSVAEDTKQPFVSNVLALLMANYGSDMSDDDDNDTIPKKVEMPVLNVEKNVDPTPIQQIEGNGSFNGHNDDVNEVLESAVHKQEDLESGPEECGIDREDRSNIPIVNSEKPCTAKVNETQSSKCKLNITRPKFPPMKQLMKRHQLSLLEKLLRNEILHERNVILQCVRYVVKKNFLGCGNNSNQQPAGIN